VSNPDTLLSSSKNEDRGRPTPGTKPLETNEFDFVAGLAFAGDTGVGGVGVGVPGCRETSVERLGCVSLELFAFSGCSALWAAILYLGRASVDKAAGTEGLQGLSGAGRKVFPSSESLGECADSEVSSDGPATAGRAVGTGTEGLQRSSLSMT
jgi:hypothetical protein